MGIMTYIKFSTVAESQLASHAEWGNSLWCRKDGNQRPFIIKLVSILDDHVCSTYKVHILFISLCTPNGSKVTHVSSQKGIDDALSITERNTPLVIFPIDCRIRRIGPYEIIE
jgi:hypothetical protein